MPRDVCMLRARLGRHSTRPCGALPRPGSPDDEIMNHCNLEHVLSLSLSLPVPFLSLSLSAF